MTTSPIGFEADMLIALPNGAYAVTIAELTDAWLCRWVVVEPPFAIGGLFELDTDPDGLALARIVSRGEERLRLALTAFDQARCS